MSFDLAAVGRPGDEHPFEVTEEALRAYADATDDVVGGPVFALLPVWGAAGQVSRAVASDDVRPNVVHYEQDLVLHRPLADGMRVRSRATPVALLGRPNGTSVVIRTETRAEDGELVNEQYITEFFRGVEAPESVGERAPDHRLEAEEEPVAEITYPVAEDQTVRYADASGDHFAIHLDDDFARSVGLPGRIVHGLCTMAFTGRAVLEAAGGRGSSSRIERLAVRFSAPLFPGDTLTTRIWDLGGGSYGFEAVSGQGATVVKDGRAVHSPRLTRASGASSGRRWIRRGPASWSAPGAPEKISVITPRSSFVERYANVMPLYSAAQEDVRPRAGELGERVVVAGDADADVMDTRPVRRPGTARRCSRRPAARRAPTARGRPARSQAARTTQPARRARACRSPFPGLNS